MEKVNSMAEKAERLCKEVTDLLNTLPEEEEEHNRKRLLNTELERVSPSLRLIYRLEDRFGDEAPITVRHLTMVTEREIKRMKLHKFEVAWLQTFMEINNLKFKE